MTPPALQIVDVSKRFGGLVAVDNLSLDIWPGSIVGLIGPNGCGKSTLFNLITNIFPADAGKVFYAGRQLNGLALHRVAHLGLGRTFQEVKIFRELTVWENLALAAMGRRLLNWVDRGRRWLAEMGLSHLAEEQADSLSIGQQRLLEISMNFIADPAFLLLDEPLAGVHPVVRNRIGEVIRQQREAGRTFLLIEHDLRFVMELCDRVVVMQQGRKIADGRPQEVRNDPLVMHALLGGH